MFSVMVATSLLGLPWLGAFVLLGMLESGNIGNGHQQCLESRFLFSIAVWADSL